MNEGLSDRIFNLISHRVETKNDVEFVGENSGCPNDSEFLLVDESMVEESAVPNFERSNKIDLLAVAPEEVGRT